MADLSAALKLFNLYGKAIDKIQFKTLTAAVSFIQASSALNTMNVSLVSTAIAADVVNTSLNKLAENCALDDIAAKADEAGAAISECNDKIGMTSSDTKKAKKGVDDYNESVKKTEKSSGFLSKKLEGLKDNLLSFSTIQKGMQIMDDYNSTNTRLGLLTENPDQQKALQSDVFSAANRSGSSYASMAGSVSDMGINAGEAFQSNGELVSFTELLQKGVKAGGGSGADQASAMGQLTQAMGSGGIQGNEFDSIIQNAPVVADAIATYMGKSKEEISKLASEGQITSEVIKNAMFMASDDINKRFEELPGSFGDIGNTLQNVVLQAFGPIMDSISNLIKSDTFTDILNAITVGVNILSMAVNGLINFIVQNWPIVQALIIGFLIAAIPLLLSHVALWMVMNAPIIMTAAAIAGVIIMLQSMGVTFEDIFTFVGGVIGVFVGAFYNNFIYIWNVVAAFINFFANAFNDPVAAVQALFYDLVVNVLGFIEGIARGFEDLLGKIGLKIDLTSGITNLKESFEAKSADVKAKSGYVEYVQTKEYVDYSDFAANGGAIGKDAYDKLSGTLGGLTDSLTGTGKDPGTGDVPPFDGNGLGTSGNPVTVQGSGKNNALDVNMESEDMQYLRDIAEREYINKFSTATIAPNIEVSFGDVHETADADALADKIKRILQEEIAMTAEGAY